MRKVRSFLLDASETVLWIAIFTLSFPIVTALIKVLFTG